jgi:hypothetical protein
VLRRSGPELPVLDAQHECRPFGPVEHQCNLPPRVLTIPDNYRAVRCPSHFDAIYIPRKRACPEIPDIRKVSQRHFFPLCSRRRAVYRRVGQAERWHRAPITRCKSTSCGLDPPVVPRAGQATFGSVENGLGRPGREVHSSCRSTAIAPANSPAQLMGSRNRASIHDDVSLPIERPHRQVLVWRSALQGAEGRGCRSSA